MSYKQLRRNAEKLGESLCLILADGAFAVDNLGRDAARTEQVNDVALTQASLLHEKLQHLGRRALAHWVIMFLEVFDQFDQQVKSFSSSGANSRLIIGSMMASNRSFSASVSIVIGIPKLYLN